MTRESHSVGLIPHYMLFGPIDFEKDLFHPLGHMASACYAPVGSSAMKLLTSDNEADSPNGSPVEREKSPKKESKEKKEKKRKHKSHRHHSEHKVVFIFTGPFDFVWTAVSCLLH